MFLRLERNFLQKNQRNHVQIYVFNRQVYMPTRSLLDEAVSVSSLLKSDVTGMANDALAVNETVGYRHIAVKATNNNWV